jgi:purine-binding chemotaxis protein CheW
MTDKDRMDRAKRIREMREGSRDEDTESADGGEPAAGETSENDSEATAETDSGEESENQAMEEVVESAAEEADKEITESESEDDPAGGEEPTTSESADENESGTDRAARPESETEMTTTDQPDKTDGEQTADAETAGESDEGGVSAPLPDTETLEDALDDEQVDDGVETVAPDIEGEEGATAPATDGEKTESAGEETRVLEFRLDDEHYCLDIEYIEEIVKEETITRVPNTPEFIQGVVDLRGQITTILNPKVTLGKENTEADQLIVVFDSEAFEDQGHIGWVVDDVRQVSPITESEVNDPPVEEEYINGVIDREDDDQFVIWTSPDLALEEAET